MITLFKPFMAADVDKFILPVLHSGYIGEGPKVKAFGEEVGRFIGNDDVLPVSSGTMAIKMALRLAGVGRGDCVLTTPMTCLATNEPILELGAVPIWVDVDPITGCMSGEALVEACERAGMADYDGMVRGARDRVKAIMCMHWGGWPCSLSDIYEISEQHSIPVIEDACQALGTIYSGDYIGNHSQYVCISFQAIKHLTTVDGGAIICNDGDLERAKLMKWFGLNRDAGSSMRCVQDPLEYGYKGQMNDVAASIGLANIRHLQHNINLSTVHAAEYDKAVDSNENIWRPKQLIGNCSNYWLYTIHVDDSSDFIAYMKNNGVEAGKVHARNDNKRMFRQSIKTELPGVDSFEKTHVCIPVGWYLTDADVGKICSLIRRYRPNG